MGKQEEHLRVHKKGSTTRIKGGVFGFEYLDEETQMTMIYVPSLDIHGYGDNIDEAREMVQWSIDNYLYELCKQPVKEIRRELGQLGWRQKNLKNKVYAPNFNPLDRMEEEGIKNYNQTPIALVA